MKFKSEIITLIILVVIFSVIYAYQTPFLTGFFTFVLIVVMYYFINKIIDGEENKKYIKNNLKVAKMELTDNDKFAVIVTKKNRVLWANDYCYDEFPELLKEQNISEISMDKLDNNNQFKHNNSIYQVSIKQNLYIIENITKEVRQKSNLEENRANVAILQIDNYHYMRNNLSDENLILFEKELPSEIIDFFTKNEIYYQAIKQGKYQLLIPTSVLEQLKNTNFSEVNEIMKKYQELGIMVTYSMGIAAEYETISQTGRKAEEAFELAITRGGAQVVIFTDEVTNYYGGSMNMIKGNLKMKSRVMVNTLINVVNKREVVYMVTHRNPDSDAIASMLLMHKLLKEKTNNVEIKLIVDEHITSDLEEELQAREELLYQKNYVIDQTKRNILIVLDTQSTKIISHPQLLEQINDVIIFDHHQTPVDYIKRTIFSWIEPGATSTVEMLAELLNAAKVPLKGEKRLANLAILGFLTDTNNMKYRIDSNAIDNLSYFVAAGGSISEAREKEYMEFKDYKLKHRILSQANVIKNFSIIELTVEYNDILLSQICNDLQEIKGIDCSIVIAPTKKDMYKVKIRSNRKINSKILIEEFGGGGHARQGAGIITYENKELLINKIINYDKKGEE